ncbi:tetraacyldisaccharide 4'-kinase [Kineobactrum salinum]|uniref:Tetraacyldisaccharide 4'-kinase n=1 Tax=Kineobactrum salinum TaxID=2708301 RepID=A0A6C0U9L7_9GAMM|nr:tetraacyldisaccharide 4'-kinase [Kineobactrum salinum]QIB67365.1 tetraacyldisaccharide 4'-kinase [Kineobactrum salinum]
MAAAEPALLRAWYRSAPWLWLLRPLELLFRGVSWMRRRAYRCGLLSVYRAAVPVVVVGNITVGGTGKTPVVIALVEALQARGLRPGVISRGYGAARGAVFPHRVGADSSARDCGDEPLLIHLRTGAPCVVSPNRVAALRMLLADTTVDLVLSDDGLQHYALGRDFEIALMDASRQLGNGFCLPAGPLREPRARLNEVDYLLCRGSDDPRHGVIYESQGLVRVIEETNAAPAAIPAPGSAIHAITGIGQPQQFFASLEAAGFSLSPRVLPDHHPFSAADFAGLDDKPIIMTEKDAVKCRGFATPQMWFLKISARVPAPLLEAVAALAHPRS